MLDPLLLFGECAPWLMDPKEPVQLIIGGGFAQWNHWGPGWEGIQQSNARTIDGLLRREHCKTAGPAVAGDPPQVLAGGSAEFETERSRGRDDRSTQGEASARSTSSICKGKRLVSGRTLIKTSGTHVRGLQGGTGSNGPHLTSGSLLKASDRKNMGNSADRRAKLRHELQRLRKRNKTVGLRASSDAPKEQRLEVPKVDGPTQGINTSMESEADLNKYEHCSEDLLPF